MRNTTTMKKAHGRDPVGFQNATTNDLDFPTGKRQGKAFETLAARFAMTGHTLTRSNPADGPVIYFVGRWGWQQALPDLEAAERFLIKFKTTSQTPTRGASDEAKGKP